MTEPQTQRWPGFGYEQVPGLANRHISRYLRTQRKNMLRFFLERGFFDLALRMKDIWRGACGPAFLSRGVNMKLNTFQNLIDAFAAVATAAVLVCLAVLFVVANAAEPAPPTFIPFGVYYAGGQLVNVKLFDEQTFTDKDECMDHVRHAVQTATLRGDVMIGGCLPVPSAAP